MKTKCEVCGGEVYVDSARKSYGVCLRCAVGGYVVMKQEHSALLAVAEAVKIGRGAAYYLAQFKSTSPTDKGREKDEVETNQITIALDAALSTLASIQR